MRKIFLLFLFVFKYIIADEEESNEKYIDLLPEEEKQEFLNRIARRILADIKSGDTPSESQAVITDDQLDAHDAYVKEILKEESDNLKSEKRRKVLGNEEEYKPHESDSGNKDEHIDLTLREGRRQKRNNTENNSGPENIDEPHFDVIPVKTVYDQNYDELINITESEPFTDNPNLIGDHENNTTNEGPEIFLSDFNRTTNTANAELLNDSFNHVYINVTEKQENFRKSYKSKFRTTPITDFEPNSDERSHTNDDSNISDNVTPSSVSIESVNNRSDQGTWGSTQKIYAEENSEEKGDLYVEETTQLYQNTANNKTMQPKSFEVTSPTGNVTGQSKTASITDDHTNSDSTVNLDIEHNYSMLRSGGDSDHNLHENVHKEINSTESSLPEKFTPLPTSSVKTTENTQFIETEIFNVTESTLSLNNSEIEISEDANGIKAYTENINQTIRGQNTNILRARSDLEVIRIKDKESSINRETNSITVKPYEVFEVDAKETHFANSGNKLNNGQPFYVPVYNYAPDNAYFEPYNKYGPNIEDIKNSSSANEITLYLNENIHPNSINGRNRFFGYSNQKRGWNKDTRNVNNLNKKQSLKLLELMKPITHKLINQKIYYNPYDYPDMDYFARLLRRGRNDYDVDEENNSNSKHFPDSNEPEHPLYSIHKSETIKDHVRAIRNILYFQKLFGNVPHMHRKDKIERKANHFYERKKTSTKTNNNNIDIDYYFDRTGSNGKGKNNRMFKVNKNEQIISNIIPLTPNPNISAKKEKNARSDKFKHPDFTGISFSNLFEAMLIVLNNNIKSENENLVKYDWLQTTVNIQVAIRKLLDLIEHLQNGKYVHAKDIQLLKYILYIFNTSQITLSGKTNKRIINEAQSVSKSKNKVLPKTNRKEKIKEPLKFWKHFVYLRRKGFQPKALRVNTRGKVIYDFKEFLQSLLFYLNNLHDSIKHIAMITKYKNQNWLWDLKDIYFGNSNRKRLAQVLLHLSLSRLLHHLEESAANGVEEDFRLYLKNNGQGVKQTIEEATFVINILEELRRINVSE